MGSSADDGNKDRTTAAFSTDQIKIPDANSSTSVLKNSEKYLNRGQSDKHLSEGKEPRKKLDDILDSENVFIEDTLANKYKENEREIKRERRYQQTLRDAEIRFQNKLEDFILRETAKSRAKVRDQEREAQRQ